MGPARNVGRSLQTELYAHLSLSAHVGRTSSKQVTVPDTHAGQESYASPWQEEAGDIQRPGVQPACVLSLSGVWTEAYGRHRVLLRAASLRAAPLLRPQGRG